MSVRGALILTVIGTVIGAALGGWVGAGLGCVVTFMVLVALDEMMS